MDHRELSSEEAKAIRSLQRLARVWPKTLWLFATGRTLNIMSVGDNGERVMRDSGGVDQDLIVSQVDIPSDGGDW